MLLIAAGIGIYKINQSQTRFVQQLTTQQGHARSLASTQIINAMQNLKCCGFEAITSQGTAKGLSSTFLSHSSCGTAQAARISIDGDMRVKFDGNAPTFTEGEEMHDSEVNGVSWVFWPDNLSKFQYINDTDGTGATLNVHYY